MVRIGTPNDTSSYFAVDDGWLIFELHKANCQPEWKDGDVVYFKKNSKLKKILKKLEIVLDD